MFEGIREINVFNSQKDTFEEQKISHTGVLKRIQKSDLSGHIRSTDVRGRFALPKVGDSFILIAEAFDKTLPENESCRFIRTSKIVAINDIDSTSIEFHTLNSTYRIEEIAEFRDQTH